MPTTYTLRSCGLSLALLIASAAQAQPTVLHPGRGKPLPALGSAEPAYLMQVDTHLVSTEATGPTHIQPAGLLLVLLPADTPGCHRVDAAMRRDPVSLLPDVPAPPPPEADLKPLLAQSMANLRHTVLCWGPDQPAVQPPTDPEAPPPSPELLRQLDMVRTIAAIGLAPQPPPELPLRSGLRWTEHTRDAVHDLDVAFELQGEIRRLDKTTATWTLTRSSRLAEPPPQTVPIAAFTEEIRATLNQDTAWARPHAGTIVYSGTVTATNGTRLQTELRVGLQPLSATTTATTRP